MSLSRFHASLAEGVLPAYVILGEATPLVERARRAVEEAVLPMLGPVAFNYTKLRAGDANAPEGVFSAGTLPMMAARRLVEVRDLSEGTDALFEAVVAYLEAPSPSTTLVLVGTGFPKVEKGGTNWTAKVRAALKKGGGAVVNLGNEAVPPAQFAMEAAEAFGKTLSKQDAERLVAVVGLHLGRIEREVEKLATYVGDAKAIDGDAIEAAGSVLAEAVIWDLTAGLAVRDADLALQALHRLQEGGDDARKLLGMISWQMRELLRVGELIAQGANDREITSAAKIRWDVLKRVRPVFEASPPDAAEVLRRLATANRHMNSHRAGADRILEGLVLEMLHGTLRRPPAVPRAR